MSGLLILGAGGHGKVVADAAMAAGWPDVAFLDDHVSGTTGPLGLKVIGKFAEIEAHKGGFSAAIVAVADAQRRLQWLTRCQKAGFDTPSIIHPTAFLSRYASVAAGCVLLPLSAVNADAKLGIGCIINTGAHVEHDCVLGDAVHVCPGAHLAGNVRVADCVWIGLGAVVRQGLSIGRGATLGAGAVVVTNIEDAVTVVGIPARPKE